MYVLNTSWRGTYLYGLRTNIIIIYLFFNEHVGTYLIYLLTLPPMLPSPWQPSDQKTQPGLSDVAATVAIHQEYNGTCKKLNHAMSVSSATISWIGRMVN